MCYNRVGSQPCLSRLVGGSPIPGTTPHKKNKIRRLLRQGETSPAIIANKVGCGVSYVYSVKNELLQELLRSQEL